MVKKFIITFALILLFLNGTGAVYGGWNLIAHPDGSSLQMSVDLLKSSPFQSFLIPGIVLIIANGIFSFLVMGAILFRNKYSSLFIAGEGTILTGWIIIQVLIIRELSPWQFIYGSIGLLLIVIGWMMNKKTSQM